MEDESALTQGYNVQPTGATDSKGNPQYTDISLTALFNAHISMINTQRQTIWQRFTSMILANSIILGFLRGIQSENKLDKTDALLSLGFGILLCIAWMVMTQSGWKNLNRRILTAKAFTWQGYPGYPSPIDMEQLPGIQKEFRIDWIRAMASGVIVLFAIGYVALFLRNW